MISHHLINYCQLLGKASSIYLTIINCHKDLSDMGNTVKDIHPVPYRIRDVATAAFALS